MPALPQNITDDLYDHLLLLPLFQGLPKSDYIDMSAKIKLRLYSYRPRTVLIKQGALCEKFVFIVSGSYEVVRTSDLRDYELTEVFKTPALLQPECLYGISTCYLRTVRTKTTTQVLEVKKHDVFETLMNYETFRLNYMNILSTQAQRAHALLWRPQKADFAQRLADFIGSRSLHPAGFKLLRIRQSVLAIHFRTTVPSLSKQLNWLREQGKIKMYRGIIEVPALEHLSQ